MKIFYETEKRFLIDTPLRILFILIDRKHNKKPTGRSYIKFGGIQHVHFYFW